MKNIYIFFVFLLLININIVKGDDNVYIKSDNIIKINNDYKITNTEKIISNILIDNNNIYYYSDKNFYIVNKTNGTINYKLFISGIKNFSQSDNYIFLNDDFSVYKINKTNGGIENKQLENNLIDNIFSLFGISGTSNNIINNYYNNSSNIYYNNSSGNTFDTLYVNTIQPTTSDTLNLESISGTGYYVNLDKNYGLDMWYHDFGSDLHLFNIDYNYFKLYGINLDMNNKNIINSPDLDNKWNKTDNINGSVDKNLSNYTNYFNWINNTSLPSLSFDRIAIGNATNQISESNNLTFSNSKLIIGTSGINNATYYNQTWNTYQNNSTVNTLAQTQNGSTLTSSTISIQDQKTCTGGVYGCTNTTNLMTFLKYDGNCNDSSGNNYNGIASGGLVCGSVQGKYNNGTYFDGSNDIVTINSTAFIFNSGNFSFDIAVNPAVLDATYDGIITTDIGGSDAAWKIVRNVNNQYFTARFSGSLGFDYPIVAPNTFHIYGYDKNGDKLKLYFDGLLYSTNTVPLTHTGTGTVLVFGSYRIPNEGRFFKGIEDNFKIYNRSRSGDEFLQDYLVSIQSLQAKYGQNSTWSGYLNGTSSVSLPYAAGETYTNITWHIPGNTTNGNATCYNCSAQMWFIPTLNNTIGGSIFKYGDIQAYNLSGNGNAYACIDSIGKLYRSAVVCI